MTMDKSELKKTGKIKTIGNSFEKGTEKSRLLESGGWGRRITVITGFWRKDA